MTRAAALGLVFVACASALHEPPPISSFAPGNANGRSVDELIHVGDTAWQRRAEPGQAAAAQAAYVDAAAADDHRVDALLDAMRAISFRIEREPDAPRGQLAEQGVELGQWCQRRARTERACDYRLAIALGQQARERHATGHDALGRMVDLLHKAITDVPALDNAGPHRVLAFVLVRAPSWPVGPGDPNAALAEASAAVQLAPNFAANQLALGEALAANDAAAEARAAYRRAVVLAESAQAAGDPDATFDLADAHAALAKLGGR